MRGFVHKTTMQQLLTAIDEEDWTTLESLFAPRVRYEVPGREPLCDLEQLLHYYRVERQIVDGRHRVDGIIADGAHAMSWGRFSAKTAGGASLDVRFADLCRFDGRLIDSRTVYFFAAPG